MSFQEDIIEEKHAIAIDFVILGTENIALFTVRL